MSDYRITRPAIRWGAGFANLLQLGYALDNVRAGDEPRAGSTVDQAPSGVEDAWTTGVDYVLSADVRWIPRADTAAPAATGWDGAAGFRAFLAWARDKNLVRWYPDVTDAATFIDSYLVEPMQGQGDNESDGTRRIPLKLRNSSTPYNGY
jgi:hypothetical protein